MKFELNGETHETPSTQAPPTIQDLLERLELGGRRVAVAVNDEVVPRSRFAQVKIDDGDRVEIIQAVGGG